MRAPIALPPLALLIALGTSAHAASPAYDKCVAAIDMAGLVGSQRLDCATTDMDRADAELNATYRDTMAHLPPDGQATLRQEERAWIEHRKQVCAAERQPADPSRDINRMLCLVRETDSRTKALSTIR